MLSILAVAFGLFFENISYCYLYKKQDIFHFHENSSAMIL